MQHCSGRHTFIMSDSMRLRIPLAVIVLAIVFLHVPAVPAFAWYERPESHQLQLPNTHVVSTRWHSLPSWYPYNFWKRRRRNLQFPGSSRNAFQFEWQNGAEKEAFKSPRVHVPRIPKGPKAERLRQKYQRILSVNEVWHPQTMAFDKTALIGNENLAAKPSATKSKYLKILRAMDDVLIKSKSWERNTKWTQTESRHHRKGQLPTGDLEETGHNDKVGRGQDRPESEKEATSAPSQASQTTKDQWPELVSSDILHPMQEPPKDALTGLSFAAFPQPLPYSSDEMGVQTLPEPDENVAGQPYDDNFGSLPSLKENSDARVSQTDSFGMEPSRNIRMENAGSVAFSAPMSDVGVGRGKLTSGHFGPVYDTIPHGSVFSDMSEFGKIPHDIDSAKVYGGHFENDDSGCEGIESRTCRFDLECSCFGFYHCSQGRCQLYAEPTQTDFDSGSLGIDWHDGPVDIS